MITPSLLCCFFFFSPRWRGIHVVPAESMRVAVHGPRQRRWSVR
nr:MAG TPA: hypothetical protein [Caudoviricetes sp.]